MPFEVVPFAKPSHIQRPVVIAVMCNHILSGAALLAWLLNQDALPQCSPHKPVGPFISEPDSFVIAVTVAETAHSAASYMPDLKPDPDSLPRHSIVIGDVLQWQSGTIHPFSFVIVYHSMNLARLDGNVKPLLIPTNDTQTCS